MLIDTNILIYAINEDSSKHEQAKAFLKENKDSLEITHQNVLESLRVLTHPKYSKVMKLEDATEAVFLIVNSCRLITPTIHTIYIFFDLITLYALKSDQVFDAYLAATALSNNVDTIATDNEKDFKKFANLKVINPF